MRSISLTSIRSVATCILFSFICLGSPAFAQEPAKADTAAAPAAAGEASGDAAAGEAIFKQKCTACHSISQKVVGPALKGMSERHEEEWLIKWIRNSQALVAAGDPQAVKLFEENNKVPMTSFEELSDDDIKNIIAYVKQEEAPKAAPAVAGDNPSGNPGVAGGGTSAGGSGGFELNNYVIGGLVVLMVLLIALIVVISQVLKTLNNLKAQRKSAAPADLSVQHKSNRMAELMITFRELAKNKKLVFFTVLMVLILLGSLSWKAMWNTGVHQGYQPTQPIAYSHQLHAGTLKIDCQYCHSGAYKSKNASIPSANVCMNCHNYVQATEKYNGEISPEIMKIYNALDYNPETKEYGENPKPIEWVRIHNLPDFAYFNHAQHVTVAGLKCQQCHGPIETMQEVYQYSPLTMKWCIDCHRTNDVKYKGNDYYNRIIAVHEQVKKGEKVTPALLGGIECGKCHY